ncbi:MAG: MFS transporter [Salinibacterium sp.]|nr:MFS transporter [Salinibacterium sp.]MBF0673364.1 MFS transporter [Salinibacterium sp.]
MSTRLTFLVAWRGAFPRTLLAALLIWAAYWLAITVLQWHVAELPGSTPDTLGLLYFIQLSPMLFLTPFVGRFLDQVGGRPVLIAAASFMTLVGVAGWLLAEGELLHFGFSAALSAGLGLCMAVGSPSIHAFVPTTVTREALPRAIRLVAVGQNVARLLGPMAAGLLLLGVGVSLSLVFVSIVALTGLLLVVPANGLAPRPRRSAAEVGSVFSGFQIASRSPLARRALLLTLANSIFGLSHVAMLPIVANTVLSVGEAGYASMMSAGGLGAMLGAIFPLARIRTFRPISILFALHAAGLVLLALAPALSVAVLASGVLSCVGVMTAITLNIRLQAGLDPETRGRVMSLYTWAWGGFLPIGGLLLGGIGGLFSVQAALIVAGVLLLLVAAVNLLERRS